MINVSLKGQAERFQGNKEQGLGKALTITRLMSLILVFLPMDGKELNKVRRGYSDGGHEHSVIRTSQKLCWYDLGSDCYQKPKSGVVVSHCVLYLSHWSLFTLGTYQVYIKQ